MMRIPGVKRVARKIRRMAGIPASNRAVILLYHRIAQPMTDPWDLCVSPQNFAQHLRVLETLGMCKKMCDVKPALADTRRRVPLFSITFDDGYADNAEVAWPILAEYRVPATFFIVSEMVGSKDEFWWDALERIFLTPGKLPTTLQLEINGTVREWVLGAAAEYSMSDFKRDSAWNAEESGVTGRRQDIFLDVWQLLAERPKVQREAMLAKIRDWAGVEAVARPGYSPMSQEQLIGLAQKSLIEIGAHTRSHSSLPDLSVEAQVDEIRGGKSELEQLIDRPVRSFSYPFGRFTEATEQAVGEARFSAACTSQCRAVSRESRELALPRVQVKNWDGPTFRKVVMSYL